MSSSSPPYTNTSAEHAAGADDVTGYMEQLSVNETGKQQQQQQSEEATGEGYGQVTFRALITSKEAGIIIGKAGAVMSEMREKTAVKAGVSKNTVGVNDRVLTMTGEIDGVARFLSMCADRIDAEGFHAEAGASKSGAEIRLLCPTSLVGYVIGRAGARIKEIRETSGVDIFVESNELPGSSERIVEVRGSGEGVRTAVSKIGAILADNWERGMGTVLYNPLGHEQNVQKRNVGNYLWSRGGERSSRAPSDRRSQQPRESTAPLTTTSTTADDVPASTTSGDEIIQHISIPGDMVGCIIGRGGSKITEIRRLSGANINIAKLPHEGAERMFTLRGSAEQNEKALFLLYQQLEGEKERRTEEAAAQAAQIEQE
ncbi:RNA binding protein, heterogenous nuclear RNP-K like protein [Saitoella coloradoensis]